MAKEKPTTKICKYCKTEIPYDAKVCPQCRRKLKGGKLKWIVLILILIVVIALIFSNGDSHKLSDDATSMTSEEYMSACKQVKYDDLARSVETYKGEKLVFTGKIQQVVSDTEYLVEVTKGEYDIWDNSIYLYIDNPTEKLLEDDIIQFYGEGAGDVSYTSVLGTKITVPAITVAYLIRQ